MKLLQVTCLAMAALLAAGCAGPQQTPDPIAPDQLVRERAQARWDALLAKDYETAYGFYSPGFRQMTRVLDYAVSMSNRPVEWLGAEVLDSECESELKCSVTTAVSYRVPSGPTGIDQMKMRRTIDEIWLKLEDGWWYSPN